VPSLGVIAEDPARGLVEIARPVGVVAAITPATNPAATPANNLLNAIKARNAIVLAPSPRGASTCALLLDYVRPALAAIGAPADLVQQLPAPTSKAMLAELMAQADLVIATGSRANVDAAYRSGTPALGVGAGNVAAIVLPGAEVRATAARIATSKTFDQATSCSSENSLVVPASLWPALLEALRGEGGVLATAAEKAQLQACMFPDGKLAAAVIARPAPEIAARAGLDAQRYASCRFILVEEDGVGPAFPFSGEKLSPVLAVYTVSGFDAAIDQVRRLYAYQGAGHSVGIHGASPGELLRLGNELPVARVIADQIHCYAVGGAFDNGLPFSLSMGCGSWGGNSFSDNLQLRHFLNITRIVRRIPERPADEATIFADYWRRCGR